MSYLCIWHAISFDMTQNRAAHKKPLTDRWLEVLLFWRIKSSSVGKALVS